MLNFIKGMAVSVGTVMLAMVLGFLLATSLARAGDFHFLELNELSLDLKSYMDGGHYPLITDNGLYGGRLLDKELNMTVKTDILHYLYWDSTIHSMTDRTKDKQHGQFRTVGLEFGFGVRLSSSVEVGYYHFSEHMLDASFPWHFPVRDAIQVKFFLYRAKGQRETVF